ncbi:MAG: lipoate--protein ligase family protein [Proteobacteria bacterium]|nr:lipoate--protein ligase family protein [Pseudomonadota bacterium]
MNQWRFLNIDWMTYAETAMYRPTMIRSIQEGWAPEILAFCTFSKPSIVMNYFNDPDRDINMDYCREKDITVNRILSGGGPILGDIGYICTFFHLKTVNPNVPGETGAMIARTLSALAKEISRTFNVECRFRPLNDVEILSQDGRWQKIGPSSCIYDNGVVQVVSGLQVKKPDTNLMERAIITPPEKFQDKEAKSVKERVTHLESGSGREVKIDELKEVYKRAAADAFQVECIDGELTDEERQLYENLRKEYTSEEFFGERSESRIKGLGPKVKRNMILFKVPQGPLVRLATYVDPAGRLAAVHLTGSLHASPLKPISPIHAIETALRNAPLDRELIEEKIRTVLTTPDFLMTKVSPDLLAEKIVECAAE